MPEAEGGEQGTKDLAAASARAIQGSEAAGPPPQVLAAMMASFQWGGPLPHPSDLRAYGEINASFPDRIVKMAEAEGDHRRTKEKRGQGFGLLIALAGIVAGVILVLTGHDVAGTILGGVPLATLAAIFVTGQYAGRTAKAES